MRAARFILLLSDPLIAEMREVPLRPELTRKYSQLSAERVDQFAGDAEFLVTWNERHLTYLAKGDRPEGAEFCRRFPRIRILTPPAFLTALLTAASVEGS